MIKSADGTNGTTGGPFPMMISSPYAKRGELKKRSEKGE
jgi:hypothetical protein